MSGVTRRRSAPGAKRHARPTSTGVTYGKMGLDHSINIFNLWTKRIITFVHFLPNSRGETEQGKSIIMLPVGARERRGIISTRTYVQRAGAGLGAVTRAALRRGIQASRELGGGAATVVGGGAAALGALKMYRRGKAGVNSSAGPSFNPGSSGGYVQKFSKGKGKKKKATVLSKRQKEAVRAIAERADLVHKVKFLDQENTYFFPLQTSTTFPLIPFAGFFNVAPSALATTSPPRGCVGWNQLEDGTNTKLKALYASLPIKQGPYVSSGTNEPRVMDLSDLTGLAKQFSFKHELHWEFLLKNLSNTGAQVDIYLLKCEDETAITPSQDLNEAYKSANINATTPTAGNDPPTITSMFDQYWSSRGSSPRTWTIKKRQRAVLNPGDEATLHFDYNATLKFRGLVDPLYIKGCWAIIARIQGDLSVDTVDCSQVNMAAANVACRMHRTHKISVSRREYDGVQRIGAPVAGTIVIGKVAGDAQNFAEDF